MGFKGKTESRAVEHGDAIFRGPDGTLAVYRREGEDQPWEMLYPVRDLPYAQRMAVFAQTLTRLSNEWRVSIDTIGDDQVFLEDARHPGQYDLDNSQIRWVPTIGEENDEPTG